MHQVKPKKALGQHFLTDLHIAEKIAATLEPYSALPVIEVGPGMGVLTQFLMQSHPNLKVVEIDGESVEWLRNHYPSLQIVEEDFLKVSDEVLVPGDEKFCVIGNYPYNISSQIFFRILDWKERVICCSGMLQKEVAERIAAKEGSKARGILSVLLQAWYDVEYLFTVDEHVFNPPPKVKSGVIRLIRNNVTDLGCDPDLFKIIVKTTFGQRRKTIRNSIKSLIAPGKTLPDNELLALRPEQLSVKQFIDLTNLLSSLKK